MNWVDSSLLEPVDRGWKVTDVKGSDGHVLVVSLTSEASHFLGLIVSLVGEHVVAEFVGHIWLGVPLIDELVLLGEKSHSELELTIGSIRLTELSQVCHVLLVYSKLWTVALSMAPAG